MRVFKIGLVIGALAMFTATMAPMMLVHAQFAEAQTATKQGGPVAVGQQMLHRDDTGIALVQSAPPSGGVIQ